MLMTSLMSLYFMILSADVVDVRDGDAFTFAQSPRVIFTRQWAAVA